jgi:hypothetical protein
VRVVARSGTIFSILPWLSKIMRVSTVSKSIAPRRLRSACSAWNRSYSVCRSCGALPPESLAQTSV